MSTFTSEIFEHCQRLRWVARRLDDFEHAARMLGLGRLQEALTTESDTLRSLAESLQQAYSREVDRDLRTAEAGMADTLRDIVDSLQSGDE